MRVTRRRFLTYIGLGTYGLLRGTPSAAEQAVFPLPRRRGKQPAFFQPIEASVKDELLLPKGYQANLVCAWGDALGTKSAHGDETFGFDCDFLAYFPIDALKGGKDASEGLLFVNHENANPVFVSKWNGKDKKTEDQIRAEKLAVGASVIHIRKVDGKWRHLPGSKYTRRYCALYPKLAMTGPAAALCKEAAGTLANCSGGRTPWFTALSCEENFHDFNAVDGDGEYKGLRWSEVAGQQIDEDEFGWIVEIDPFGELPPQKHTCLGRFAHENAAWRIGRSGKMVIYMGDDAQDQFLYKFVSADKLDPKAARADQRKLLSAGTLYVADFARGQWLALDLDRNKKLADAGFKSQADLLMRTREAAKKAGATPIDRPEDCEVHPADGSLYLALTNRKAHGNVYGHIVRLVEDKDDPEREAFRFEIFLAGGPQCGLACPDNLLFDRKGNLWVACDISTRALNQGAYDGFGNNGLYVVPTAGDSAGDAFQFASGPVQSELTGPWFSENEDTLFLSVQHPGASTVAGGEPTSHWPDGGAAVPRPGVVAITGFN